MSNDGATWTLVTGAGGFVGRHCVRTLLEAGHRVVALQRKHKSIAGVPDTDTDMFRRLIGDLTNPISCPYPVSAIVHLAAQVVLPHTSAAQFAAGNILTTMGMLDLASALGVKTVIFHSSISVYGRTDATVLSEALLPCAPATYGATKYVGELLVEEHATRRHVIIPRTPGIIGPGANPNWIVSLVERARQGEPLTISNPDALFNSTLHVDDYCRFILSALQVSHREPRCDIINVAAGAPMPVEEVAEIIASQFTPPVPIERRTASRKASTITIEKLESLFGFRPMTVRDTILRYIKNPAI